MTNRDWPAADARDRLFEALGRSEAGRRAREDQERFVAALIRGEATILGSRVRLEWVDPPPAWADAWAARWTP